MRLADAVARHGQALQRQAWQPLQQRVAVEHLAALAPGAVEHDQPQPGRVAQVGRCQRGWWRQAQGAALRRIGVEQHRLPRTVQQGAQGGLVKDFAHHHAAVGQAQVQQPGAALGLRHLLRVLQDQHVHRVLHRCHPPADTAGQRAQADGAVGAHGRHRSAILLCKRELQTLDRRALEPLFT